MCHPPQTPRHDENEAQKSTGGLGGPARSPQLFEAKFAALAHFAASQPAHHQRGHPSDQPLRRSARGHRRQPWPPPTPTCRRTWPGRVEVTPNRDPAHGDMATNAALVTARAAKRKPAEIAALVAEALTAHPNVAQSRARRPRLRQHPPPLPRPARPAPAHPARRRHLRRHNHRPQRRGQRRIRLRQPHRPHAYRPLPRRRRR